MFIFTVTNLRKKGSIALKLALVLVLAIVLIPHLHGRMLEVNAPDEMQVLLPETPPQLPGEEELEPVEPQLFAHAEPEHYPEDDSEIRTEDFPGEPVRVDGQLWLPLAFWQDLAENLSH